PPLVGGDPLPQRRPAGPWGSDGEAEGAPPRPEGPSAGAATASSGLPTYPPSMAPPPGAYPEPGSPGGAGGPTASAYPAPHTYPPGLSTSATPTRPPT